MPKSTKILLTDLPKCVQPADVFVCSASFETRSKSIPEQLESVAFTRVLVCANENFPKVFRHSARKLQEQFGNAARLVSLNTNEPLRTADSLREAIDSALEANLKRFVVDITTFTHESLLILLRILQLRSIGSIEFLYTTAKEYSVGDPDDQKWLTKGIGEVRSVLGFPGRAVPSHKLHLIIMAGFEADRAERLLQEYEPSQISLGLGDPDYSVSPNHFRTNKIFYEKLLEKYANVLQFTFSCTDPEATRDALRAQARVLPGHNVLVAPLNTKISTVGAGLLALEDDAVQICYATAHHYNEAAYSTPGEHCYYFSSALPGISQPSEAVES
ncbi:MAG: hypothetical protein JO097_10530 [Acidobacteriaceae bacterium]|nr:hypothetical protein [Acidobacteriaceae bacterium]